jgi:DNA polymerase-3 subunit chi
MSNGNEPIAEYRQLADPDDLLPLVCSLTQRAHRAGRRIVICTSESRADALDSMLWTFRQNSFIPHGRLEELEEPLLESAVILTDDPNGLPEELYDVLIVAHDDDMPPSFERFRRVQDFAPGYDPEAQKAARSRYATCKDAGFHMRFVPLKQQD